MPRTRKPSARAWRPSPAPLAAPAAARRLR